MAANKEIKVFSLLKEFQSQTNSYKGETRKSFRKVFLSFKNFVFSRYLSDRPFNEELLCEWYVYLRFRGINPSKAYYYLDKLGNLYSGIIKKDQVSQSRLFKDLRKKVKESDSSDQVIAVSLKLLPEFLQNIIKEDSENPQNELGRDLLLFSLCNGGLPVEDLSLLKKEDLESFDPESRKIANQYIEPRRKYVFPLGQSLLTQKQAAEAVSKLINPWVKSFCDVQPINDTLRTLWLSIAIYCGINPYILASFSDNPASVSFLNLCKRETSDYINKKEINSGIAGSLFTSQKKWFALRLRQHVQYEELESRLSSIDNLSLRPELFYPCEEITKRIGHKLVWKQKPFIHDIVFFKSRPVDVYTICREIWDLAWCYRETRYGSYAEISEKDLRTFQNTIGIFSSEYEVAPLGEMPLKPGDRVVVVGGDFINKTGRILNLESQDNIEGNVVYRIQLFDSNHNWSVGLDARFIRPE